MDHLSSGLYTMVYCGIQSAGARTQALGRDLKSAGVRAGRESVGVRARARECGHGR